MIKEKLSKIQKELKAPKNQYNSFGGYNYRSCEDILEAVKPLLGDCILTISDDIISVGDRVYVKATATLSDKDGQISTTAFAREAESRKGSDCSQLTGASSSYARKYALAGLLLLDDQKDADSTNTHGNEDKPLTDRQKKTFKEWLVEHGENVEDIEKRFGKIDEMTHSDYGKALTYIKNK